MRLTEPPAATVANMEDNHCVGFDGEENPVLMGLAAIEKPAHLERKSGSSGASMQRSGSFV
jgi:hypothetical protein